MNQNSDNRVDVCLEFLSNTIFVMLLIVKTAVRVGVAADGFFEVYYLNVSVRQFILRNSDN